jgi:hypothetical protein
VADQKKSNQPSPANSNAPQQQQIKAAPPVASAAQQPNPDPKLKAECRAIQMSQNDLSEKGPNHDGNSK